MNHLIFTLKSFLTAVALVILLQIKIGQGTIEEHTTGWFQNSAIISPLYGVVNGGAALINDLWIRVSGGIHQQLNEAPLEKSKEVLLDGVQQGKEKMREELRSQMHQQIEENLGEDESDY